MLEVMDDKGKLGKPHGSALRFLEDKLLHWEPAMACIHFNWQWWPEVESVFHSGAWDQPVRSRGSNQWDQFLQFCYRFEPPVHVARDILWYVGFFQMLKSDMLELWWHALDLFNFAK